MKLGIVEHWHEALDAGAAEDVVRLTTEVVEVRGPRGTAQGHAAGGLSPSDEVGARG